MSIIREEHRVYSPRRKNLPMDEITERYLAGESVKALAAEYAVARTTINNRFRESGVAIRGRGAAMKVRMSRTPPEERRRLAAAAQQQRRRTPNEQQSRVRRAHAREAGYYERLCWGEVELAGLLSERGHFPEMQKALGPYNVDLAYPPVAVEVHRHASNPLSMPGHRERTRNLVNAGWKVIYVWVNLTPGTEWSAPTPALADHLAALIESAQRDPSSVRQYLVVRGSGEDAPTLSLDPDEVAAIPAPERASYLRS